MKNKILFVVALLLAILAVSLYSNFKKYYDFTLKGECNIPIPNNLSLDKEAGISKGNHNAYDFENFSNLLGKHLTAIECNSKDVKKILKIMKSNKHYISNGYIVHAGDKGIVNLIVLKKYCVDGFLYKKKEIDYLTKYCNEHPVLK